MKKILKATIGLACVAGLLSSCAVTLPVAVTNNPIGSKTGISKSVILFGGIYLNGNYSVAEAAKNGKIKGGISTVDEKTSSFVIVHIKELIVTGE